MKSKNMNIEMNSPLAAAIKLAKSHQLSSKEDVSASARSDRWVRVKDLLFRDDVLTIEVKPGVRQDPPERVVRLHVLLSVGKIINVNVVDPRNLEAALETIKSGEWDMSYFDDPRVEAA